MSNSTYNKLINEITLNEHNPYFEDELESRGLIFDDIYGANYITGTWCQCGYHFDTETAKEIRKTLKARGLWIEDTYERDLFEEIFPMETSECVKYAKAVFEYRQLCKANKSMTRAYETVLKKYAA